MGGSLLTVGSVSLFVGAAIDGTCAHPAFSCGAAGEWLLGAILTGGVAAAIMIGAATTRRRVDRAREQPLGLLGAGRVAIVRW